MSKYDEYPLEDWRYEVSNGDTKLGYEAWVNHNVESAEDPQLPESISTDGSIAAQTMPAATSGDMIIDTWIKCPEACDETVKTTDELLGIAGRLLDHAYSHEIVGECLFKGEDGKYYVGNVEFMITEAHPDYVKAALAELEEEKQ